MATIRQRNGKYHVQVRRRGHPTITKTFINKQDAQQWARLKEVQLDRCELAPDITVLKQTTLSELVIRYRDEVVSGKKGAEIETIILNAFLRHPICKRSLAELSSAEFAAYRDDRLKGITAKSLKRQLSPIHNMFEVARDEWGLPIGENPLDQVKLKAIDNRRERRLREGELERLIEAARTRRNPLMVPIILFALGTAMRRGEILNMSWDHMDWERHSVTIPDSKNGHSRTIPLTDKAYALVQAISREGQRVFPVSANAVRLSWERICIRAGISDLHFHDLRHEAISRFFEIGLSVPEVALISGHRDMRMLFRYSHATRAAIREKLRS